MFQFGWGPVCWILVSEIPTPALLVDRARLHANLDAMQARADTMEVALRPHAKTHKSPDLARLQHDRGAKGLTVATVDEAVARRTAENGHVHGVGLHAS